MALKGTLKDFGISDIFQLIGHQSKTGILTLKNADHEVRITFLDGNVMRAESSTRDRKELLGAMLQRAQALNQRQLDNALDIQRRTLRRLGDILIECGYVNKETLRDFTRLQTTETIYKLFLWTNGTYEFTAHEGERPKDEGLEAIRSENVLMEGFRMVDEWPIIRKHITSYGMTFRVVRQLDAGAPPVRPAAADFADDVDDAFGAMEAGGSAPAPESNGRVGRNERLVHALVKPGRDVQTIVDLSRLGEFESCKALYNLVQEGYLDPIPAAPAAGTGLTEGGALEPRRSRPLRLGRVQAAAGSVAGAVVLALLAAGLLVPAMETTEHLTGVRSDAARLAAAEVNLTRLRRAVEVYRLQNGQYPGSLNDVVESGLIRSADLHRPFERPYAYARHGESYELVRPYY